LGKGAAMIISVEPLVFLEIAAEAARMY